MYIGLDIRSALGVSRDIEQCGVPLKNGKLCDNPVRTSQRTCGIAPHIESARKAKVEAGDTDSLNEKGKNVNKKVRAKRARSATRIV